MLPALSELLRSSSYTVALTGAGVSTLSGIPDFRGQKGLYQDPRYLQAFDIDLFRADPTVYYGAFRDILYGPRAYEPNLVHTALARLETDGALKAVVTQNIDGLHGAAGSKTVCEIHGSAALHHCLACGSEQTLAQVRDQIQDGQLPPRCFCGGVLKPDITFFGEELPREAFDRAFSEASRCALLLVLGTSLTVYPAASLPELVLRRRGRIVIVNAQPTPLDEQATLRLWSLQEAFE
jgi:NAD-dependent deacetylase